MWESFKLFFKELSKHMVSWISFGFLLLAVYESCIKQYLSSEYQREIYMSAELALIIAICLILLASVLTFHKLRIKTKEDFYSTNKDSRIDWAHRVFYHLHESGFVEGNARDERLQNWDRDVRDKIEKYCNEHCMKSYLIATGRGTTGREIPLLRKEYFDEAMKHIYIDHLKDNLKHCIK